jgi:hypothetical protein
MVLWKKHQGIQMSSNQAILDTTADNIVALLQDPTTNLSELLNYPVFYSTFIKKDPFLFDAFRLRLQNELLNMKDEFNSLSLEEQALVKHRVDSLLSFYSYTEPKTGDYISLPDLSSDPIKFYDFCVQRIYLTKDDYLSPYTCYGLIPPKGCPLPARIVFPGTTFLTANGFTQALLGDSALGGGVGYILYWQGAEPLQDWINNQYDQTEQPVHICGQSLGGAMSMQAYIHQPNKVSFTALNPPFLSNAEYKAYQKSMALAGSPIVETNTIIHHVLDPISKTGHWFPANTTSVYVFGSRLDFDGDAFTKQFKAHACCLTNMHNCFRYDSQDYLQELQSEKRLNRHRSLKPVRAFGFFSTLAAASVNGVVRKSLKEAGWIKPKVWGAEPLPPIAQEKLTPPAETDSKPAI